MKRSPITKSTKPPKKRRTKPRRVSVVRDKDFLDYLKTQACEACKVLKMIYRDRLFGSGGICIDPAHGPVNGMGSKGGDDGAISLCRVHHDEQHTLTWPVFEAKYGIDRAAIAAEHYARFKGEKP